jgi:hypothetical protein
LSSVTPEFGSATKERQSFASFWQITSPLAFGQIGEIVKAGDFEKFIFDKRSLRAFHQPTMEWYFIFWKKEMLEYGVKTHRKILPTEKWFEKMVQIAKNQILQTYPDNIIDQLDIRYCDTIEEAIEI